MSALDTFVTPDAVHVFTDGGMYDSATAKIQAFGNKTYLLPEYSAAISATGQAFIPVTLGGSLSMKRFDDFDALVKAFPTKLSFAFNDALECLR